MKYFRTEILISEDIIRATDDYLLKKDNDYEKCMIPTTHNNHQIIINLHDTASKHFTSNEIVVTIVVYEKVKNKTTLIKVADKKFYINKINELCSVFLVMSKESTFILNIDRESKDTIKSLKDKLDELKEKISDTVYIKNLLSYSDLSKQRELMNVCYLLISNNNIIKFDDELKKTIQEKLNYYGYTREAKEYNKDLFVYYNMNNSEEIVKLVTGRILFDIDRFDEYGKCLMGDIESSEEMQDIAFETYETYIDCLYKERVLTS